MQSFQYPSQFDSASQQFGSSGYQNGGSSSRGSGPRVTMDHVRHFVPGRVADFFETHVESTRVAITTLLGVLAMCNFFFFVGAFQLAGVLPNGANALLVAILSCAHTAMVWTGVRQRDTAASRRVRLPSHLSGSPFWVGVLMGTSLGIGLLNLVMSFFFSRAPICGGDTSANATDPFGGMNTPTACKLRNIVQAVWFFGAVVFWLNCLLTFFLWNSREELATAQDIQYSDISGIDMDEYDPQRPIPSPHAARHGTMENGWTEPPNAAASPAAESSRSNFDAGGYGAQQFPATHQTKSPSGFIQV